MAVLLPGVLLCMTRWPTRSLAVVRRQFWGLRGR